MTIAWVSVGIVLGCAMVLGQFVARRQSTEALVSTAVTGALIAVAYVAHLGEWTAVGPVLLGYLSTDVFLHKRRTPPR